MFSLNLLGGVWDNISGSLVALWESTGLYSLVSNFTNGGWQNLVMIAIACVLVYLAVVKKGDVILVLEAMKMDNDITAPCDGTISYKTTKGSNVDTGDLMAVIG